VPPVALLNYKIEGILNNGMILKSEAEAMSDNCSIVLPNQIIVIKIINKTKFFHIFNYTRYQTWWRLKFNHNHL
jgi:hypothetical protein